LTEPTTICWANWVKLRARYQRSVHLERDASAEHTLDGYLVTPLVQNLATRICAGLLPDGTARAWSLTGPFGSGKSAFALFLAEALAIARTAAEVAARGTLRKTVPEGLAALFGDDGPLAEDGGLCPVLVTGERRPLDALLVSALCRSLEAHWTGRGSRPDIFVRVKEAAAQLENGARLSARDVVSLFEEAARALARSTKSGSGLLVVLDEAGKALEFAAQDPAQGDVQLLQELAEASSRSGSAPIVFIVVLHQAFDQYASRLTTTQRNEWAKVQGRFEDVIFQEASDQLLRMVGTALEVNRAPAALISEGRAAALQLATLTNLPGVEADQLASLLLNALPLHPVTALVAGPLFRSRLSQNERSLFAFLCSAEPHGFRSFVQEQTACDAPFFPLDRLYEYVLHSLGSRVYGQDAHPWAQTEAALRRLPSDATALDARVLRVVGILNALGDAAGIAASSEVIVLALEDRTPENSREQILTAIDRLQRASILVYRKYKGAFQLFEGSDLDIDRLVRHGLEQIDPRTNLTKRLTRIIAPRPVVARRHLFTTGTLRFFEVRYADERIVSEGIGDPETEADGVLYLLVPSRSHELDGIREALRLEMTWSRKNPVGKPVVVAVPMQVERIHELAGDVAALEWVSANTPQLQSDPAARRELAGRLFEAERLLRHELALLLAGRRPATWHLGRGCFEVRSARDLVEQVSRICDSAYQRTPRILNEMLNREHLSSAAAAARRELMQAMVEHKSEARLGIVGNPPELSMYRSLLEVHGLHRIEGDEWILAKPHAKQKGSLQHAFEAIERTLQRSEAARVSLDLLYKELAAPPYGIKAGPLPIIVLAALLEQQSEVALYEEGVFQPAITAALVERLLRSPDKFEVQRFEVKGARAELFNQLVSNPAPKKGAGSQLLPVVRQLVRMVRELPEYTRNTKRLSEQSVAVREALLRAREPAPLMFEALPTACGMPPLKSSDAGMDTVPELVNRLKASLRELQAAYPRLLELVQSELRASFALPEDPEEAKHELVARSKAILPIAVDTQLKGFLLRSSNDAADRDSWLISIATFLGGKPPEFWLDRDVDSMALHLAGVVRRFRGLEAFAVERAEAQLPNGTTLLRIAVAQPGTAEREQVVAVRREEEASVNSLRTRLRELIDGAASMPTESILASLALVAREYVEQMGGGEETLEKRRSYNE